MRPVDLFGRRVCEWSLKRWDLPVVFPSRYRHGGRNHVSFTVSSLFLPPRNGVDGRSWVSVPLTRDHFRLDLYVRTRRIVSQKGWSGTVDGKGCRRLLSSHTENEGKYF